MIFTIRASLPVNKPKAVETFVETGFCRRKPDSEGNTFDVIKIKTEKVVTPSTELYVNQRLLCHLTSLQNLNDSDVLDKASEGGTKRVLIQINELIVYSLLVGYTVGKNATTRKLVQDIKQFLETAVPYECVFIPSKRVRTILNSKNEKAENKEEIVCT